MRSLVDGGAVAFTDDGLMARAVASLRRPVWIDRDGHRQELESMPPADYQTPSLSRAGDRLAVAMTEEGGSSNIWIYDLATDRRSRLTLEGENTSPVWPLVITATTPRWAASQDARRRSAASSMRWSGVNGQAIAGMMPR